MCTNRLAIIAMTVAPRFFFFFCAGGPCWSFYGVCRRGGQKKVFCVNRKSNPGLPHPPALRLGSGDSATELLTQNFKPEKNYVCNNLLLPLYLERNFHTHSSHSSSSLHQRIACEKALHHKATLNALQWNIRTHFCFYCPNTRKATHDAAAVAPVACSSSARKCKHEASSSAPIMRASTSAASAPPTSMAEKVSNALGAGAGRTRTRRPARGPSRRLASSTV